MNKKTYLWMNWSVFVILIIAIALFKDLWLGTWMFYAGVLYFLHQIHAMIVK